jgi:hypothetical protein
MSGPDLKAIRARLKTAAPGPWHLNASTAGSPPLIWADDQPGAVAVVGTGGIQGPLTRARILANAQLIANAPADLAALLDHIAACHELLERVVKDRGYPDDVYSIQLDAEALLKGGES